MLRIRICYEAFCFTLVYPETPRNFAEPRVTGVPLQPHTVNEGLPFPQPSGSPLLSLGFPSLSPTLVQGV